jgi:queuine/archaeosine tRNA-ribosyltransferase
MKKILFILLICPLFSLAQTKPQPDTIKIPTHAARQIAKDLVSCDSLKAIHNLTAQQLTLTEQKVAVQDKIISSHIEKGIMYEQRIKNEQEKFVVQGKWIEDLRKQNKRLKVKLRFIQITGVAVGGLLTYLYITK